MSIQDQLEEMENLITANTSPPSTDAPGTEAPGTEAPGTEAPGTESPATEAPGTSAPSTEAPTTEAPDERMSRLERENEELRKKYADKHDKPNTKAPATKSPSTSAPATSAPLEDLDFIGDADVRDITEDKGELNKLLNKVFKQGIETARKTLGEGVLRQIPDIVKHNMVTAAALKRMSDKFYEDNEDLKPWKKVVGAVYEDIASENPDLGYDEVMKKVGDETRSRLELQKKAPSNNDRTPPRLPRKKGGRRQNQQNQPNTDPLLSELDAMDDVLNQ